MVENSVDRRSTAYSRIMLNEKGLAGSAGNHYKRVIQCIPQTP